MIDDMSHVPQKRGSKMGVLPLRWPLCLVISLLLFWRSDFLWAQGVESTSVLDASKDGRTILINRGRFEKLEIYDQAKVYIYRPHIRKLEYLTNALCVKTFNNRSIWYVPLRNGDLKKDALVYFIFEKFEYKGDLKLRKVNRVGMGNDFRKRSTKVIETEVIKELPMDLIAKDQRFETLEKLTPEEESYFRETYSIDLSTWERDLDRYLHYEVQGKEPLVVRKYLKSPPLTEVRDKIHRMDHQNYLNNFLTLLEDPKYVDKQISKLENYLGKDDRSYFNVYDMYLRDLHDKIKYATQFMGQQLQRKGESWSDEFKDEELSQLIAKNGLQVEEGKRKKAYLYRKGKHVELSALYNLEYEEPKTDHTLRREFNMRLEYELFGNVLSPDFDQFSLNFYLHRRMKNITFNEDSYYFSDKGLGVDLYFYPFDSSDRVNSLLLFLGLGTQLSSGKASHYNSGDESEYLSMGMPNFTLGLRYRFFNSLSLTVFGMIENENYNLDEAVSSGNTTSGEFQKSVSSIGAGLAVYF